MGDWSFVVEVPAKPFDELQRLHSLKTLNLLYTPLDKSLERITRLAKIFFKIPIVAISLIDTEVQWFKSIQGLDICDTTRDVSFCGHAILQDDIFIINDAFSDLRFLDNPLVKSEPNIRFYAGYPIRSIDGYKIGTLCIIDSKSREYTQEQLNALKDFAGMVEDIIHNQKQGLMHKILINELDEVERKSLIDPLTRTWNRKAIEQFLEKKLLLSKAQNEKFGLGLIDIDNFKLLNDTYGHIAGDVALQAITKTLLDCLRSYDVLARWGGEEFIAVIDTNNKNTLTSILERARKEIEKTPIMFEGNNLSISFTAGVVLVEPLNFETISKLISLADKALYEGKNNGKNRLIFANNL